MNKHLILLYSAVMMMVFMTSCEDENPSIPTNQNIVNGIDTSFVSSEFNYSSNFADVLDSKIHYLDEPSDGQETFLLLHGQPTSSYLWRNVIPHLAVKGRVVVPDLIGMGQSGKPDIEYTFQDHINYMNAFVEELGLEDIILVIHDWGSAVGFNYANIFPDNVKGIVFMEALISPISIDDVTPDFAQVLQLSFNGEEGDTTLGTGWRFNAIDNQFIETVLPSAVLRSLSEQEMNEYRKPFLNIDDRKPLWQFPRQVPILEFGDPENIALVGNYFENYLTVSETPKLLLYAEPGLLMNEQSGFFMQSIFPNLEIQSIGPGLHFIQEDQPHRIGLQINEWVEKTF